MPDINQVLARLVILCSGRLEGRGGEIGEFYGGAAQRSDPDALLQRNSRSERVLFRGRVSVFARWERLRVRLRDF